MDEQSTLQVLQLCSLHEVRFTFQHDYVSLFVVWQQNNDLLENLHSREASLAEMKCTLEKSLMMQKSLESEVSTLQELSQSNASEAEKYKSILASTVSCRLLFL